jgi:hypothetical protein
MDYTIAAPQFNVTPAQVGGPANMLTDVLKLKGLQQDQQLNQLKFQEYQRARGEAALKSAEEKANKQALISAMRNSVVGDVGPQQPDARVAANALLGQGKLDAAMTALGASEAFTKDTKAKSDLAKVDIENLDKQLSTFRTFAAQVRSPEDASVYATAMYDHPTIGGLMQKTGLTKEQAIAKAQQDYASNPQQWMASHIGLTGQQVVDTLKQTTTNTDLGGQILQQQRDAFGRPIEGGETRLDKTLTPAQGAKEMPPTVRLAQGEVWNKEAGRVDAVPGSAAYIKRSQDHAGDVTALNAVKEKTDEAIVNITKMLSDENKEGFQANFGGMGTTVTSRMAGKPKDFKGMLDTFKSNMKSAGLEMMRSGGSIGAMTEKEWPIVEAEMASLDGWMTEENARNVMRNVAARLARIKKSSENVYDMTWSETQFHPKNKKSTNSSADDITAADVIIGIGKGN